VVVSCDALEMSCMYLDRLLCGIDLTYMVLFMGFRDLGCRLLLCYCVSYDLV